MDRQKGHIIKRLYMEPVKCWNASVPQVFTQTGSKCLSTYWQLLHHPVHWCQQLPERAQNCLVGACHLAFQEDTTRSWARRIRRLVWEPKLHWDLSECHPARENKTANFDLVANKYIGENHRQINFIYAESASEFKFTLIFFLGAM